MKSTITFDQFAQMVIRVGTVLECTEKEGSEKLYRLKVDFGDEGERIILTGLKPYYPLDHFVGKQFVFIANLAPRKMMGEESQGMILAADSGSDGDAKPALLIPQIPTPAGSGIR